MNKIDLIKMDGHFWQRRRAARAVKWGASYTGVAFTTRGAKLKVRRALQMAGDTQRWE